MRIIQVLLGHASLASTARYTQVATKTISNTPSPLDRLLCLELPAAVRVRRRSAQRQTFGADARTDRCRARQRLP
ncbi:hypothetical protein [Bradyrhizobium sp. USDA 4518]